MSKKQKKKGKHRYILALATLKVVIELLEILNELLE